MTEQYWKREDGEVIGVADMNEHHAKNVLRNMIGNSKQRSQDALEIRNKICQISNVLDDIKRDLMCMFGQQTRMRQMLHTRIQKKE